MGKNISILGSTGSIGVNALLVSKHLSDEINVQYLSAYKNGKKLIEQALTFRPKAVAVVDLETAKRVQEALKNESIEVLAGREGLLEIAGKTDVDLVLNGLVGTSGMEPTIKAAQAGVDIALSNKESLVMAGELITRLCKKYGATIFPVDSEHSAIWQCLVGEEMTDVRRLILTGSGGPFRTRDKETFSTINPKEALNHPNWEMGSKITIDSATMMNKGLEVIEAYWLFHTHVDQIDIVIHPQSIIHSMVEMRDGSVKAQLGVPDMKVPIQYALTYPRHIEASWERLDLTQCGDLTFQPPDFEKFPCMKLAFDALEKGGTAPAILNILNEYAVYKFLDNEIRFTDIPKIIEKGMADHAWKKEASLEDLLTLEQWGKTYVSHFK
ncbi:MAG: 1-deoxy-D-xylulose-5-phosphate reductoisomerase [Candidatus Marinimicrobia bacterium]|jgi:1-deoxy-D-xylulose-5-phosphate reductoisomerase|nr:1-deoxy-D-xylulose-5-phosphate reductoisomerase [Candidatus Neomarinimicrobiota bacterium]MBT3495774.1 1-deoxy-D-xylulose-5-phosphate reductoisomerase [Candidatus Neomarinimicrobiota bacterium]MBT3692255.1 1-deoxy-D-xylulose-5-phosphate reductoisomerase [Candidatus Neomarinimicrobiota bacterium]MBT3731764.1 1-deoxy-D-xylulose-5-phosphate reductoisomerase [Candidatus Neomarinimicrobiota bacterium]MBT4143791.1 1-deoxy-D-xylulose-5-phosphate reductoisomerase [Candidatus Neomarinimicrobiota bact